MNAKAALDRLRESMGKDLTAEQWVRQQPVLTEGYIVPCRGDVAVGDSLEIVEKVFLPHSTEQIGYRVCRGKIIARRPAAHGFPDSYQIRITSSLGCRAEVHAKNQKRWMSSVQLKDVVAAWRKARRYESRFRNVKLASVA